MLITIFSARGTTLVNFALIADFHAEERSTRNRVGQMAVPIYEKISETATVDKRGFTIFIREIFEHTYVRVAAEFLYARRLSFKRCNSE